MEGNIEGVIDVFINDKRLKKCKSVIGFKVCLMRKIFFCIGILVN